MTKSKIKTYVFWAKKGDDKLTWTEFKATSIKEVRQWAKDNGVTIDEPIKLKKA